jgi:hypothetical protein
LNFFINVKKYFLVATLCCCCLFSTAQYHHAFYVEAGGAAITGSINYDFRFKKEVKDFTSSLGLRVGVGLSPSYTLQNNTVVSLKSIKPMALIGLNRFMDMSYIKLGSNIEYGLSVLFAPSNSIADKKGNYLEKGRVIPSLNIGFRAQDNSKLKRMYRFCYNPFLLDGKLCHWAGLSIGFHIN